jgi:hypothetical protein
LKREEVDQMHVSEEQKVQINYAEKGLPATVEKLRPNVFKAGTAFYAVIGSDIQNGIFGYGDSIKEALVDWDKNLQLKLRHVKPEDPAIGFVLNKLH